MANVEVAAIVFERLALNGLAELEDEYTLYCEDIENDLSITIKFEEDGDDILLFENDVQSMRFDSLVDDFEEEFFEYVSEALNF